MSKKLISLVLAIAMIFGLGIIAQAEESTARLYTVYGNGMLFEQNKEAIFAGEGGTPGSTIKVQLLNENYWPIKNSSAKVNDDGTFEVSFIGLPGSYNEYTVVLTENGEEFAKLENVVFGELWLASGQSNMMFPLGQSVKGLEMFNNGVLASKWLRVLIEPAYPTYNGTNAIPVDPQNDIVDAKWINGESTEIYGMSAVAYFFAEKLMKELDMPVGILNSSLGGTTIRSWLSREAIDADSLLKQELKNSGYYIEESEWNEQKIDIYGNMTANYNLRTYAYRNFCPSGLIWYQGESDLINAKNTDLYTKSFNALQQMYTDMFDYGDEFFPIIYTQIAPYSYKEFTLSDWNYNYAKMQSVLPDSRAMVTISDLPLNYLPEVGVIHPSTKQPIGERMATAALGMVYGKSDTYTAASLKSSEVKDGSIYVTLSNCGDGIVADGNIINGFAVCGKDGVYVQAQAEIISADTIKVWSNEVNEPVSASYAYCTLNTYSNLWSTIDGEKFMPVSTFVTKQIDNAVYWADKTWADCELEKAWHLLPDPHSAEFDTWKAEGAEVSINKTSAYSGENGLKIDATDSSFTVKPVQLYKINGKLKPFLDTDTDWSSYGKISFYVRNNGNTDIVLDAFRIYVDAYSWYSPAVEGTKDSSYVIPADGEWHKVTFDLDSLYLSGNECGFTYANEKLDYVFKFQLEFTGENADISIDEFNFAPDAEKLGTRFDASVEDADNPFEFISALFTMFIGLFANLFN